jgi:hypothetical protein
MAAELQPPHRQSLAALRVSPQLIALPTVRSSVWLTNTTLRRRGGKSFAMAKCFGELQRRRARRRQTYACGRWVDRQQIQKARQIRDAEARDPASSAGPAMQPIRSTRKEPIVGSGDLVKRIDWLGDDSIQTAMAQACWGALYRTGGSVHPGHARKEDRDGG